MKVFIGQVTKTGPECVYMINRPPENNEQELQGRYGDIFMVERQVIVLL